MAIYTVEVEGVEYGTDTIDTLAQWVREGRLLADTLITDTGTGIRFSVSEHPDLRECLPTTPPIAPPPPPPSPPPPPTLGAGVGQQQAQQPRTVSYRPPDQAAQKVPAGILALFLGSLGVHKFLLGYAAEGVIMLLISILGGVFTCGIATAIVGLIGFIEGIIYLTRSDEDFARTYVEGRKGWF